MERTILEKTASTGQRIEVVLTGLDDLSVRIDGKDCGRSGLMRLRTPKQSATGPVTHYMVAYRLKSNVGFTAAEAEAITAAKQTAVAQAEDDIRSGRVPIQVSYRDGEYLSGYTCYDRLACRLLADLGVASEVSGWGLHVSDALVKALGESFAYNQASDFAAPAIAAKEAAKKDADAKRDAVFEKAAETGQRQELSRYVEDCDGSVDDCSTDIVYRWAMPDGTTTTTRTHTH